MVCLASNWFNKSNSYAFVFFVDRASTSASVLSQLDNQLSNLSSQKLANKTNLELHEESLNAVIREVSEKLKDGKGPRRNVGLSGALGLDDRMDVDDPHAFISEGSRGKKWK